MIADSLDDGDGAGVPHREALPGETPNVRAAGGGAVEHGVADDHVLFGPERRVAGRSDREHAAREPFADVVVRVPDERQLETRREPGAERLPRGAVELIPPTLAQPALRHVM